MEAIGGYFSLELLMYDECHYEVIVLNTDYSFIEYIFYERI